MDHGDGSPVDEVVAEDRVSSATVPRNTTTYRRMRRIEGLTLALGHRISLLRQAARLTQRDLAELLDTDVSVVCRMETGKTTPSIHRIKAVADALAVDLHRLFRFRPRDEREWATERIVALLARRSVAEIQLIADLIDRVFPAPGSRTNRG